jgi:hypothetical protein
MNQQNILMVAEEENTELRMTIREWVVRGLAMTLHLLIG